MATTDRLAARGGTVRRVTTLPLAVLAAGTLAACGSSPAEDVDTENISGSITYWASNQGDSVTEDEQVLSETIERFTEETGVEVELEVIPWNDLQNRILTAVSSGDGPDVLNIGNTWAASMQATGAFLEWEGEVLEAIGGEERFIGSSWATGGAEGETPTSVPLYALSYSLYYNTEIFEENGIEEPPGTWEEFVDVAQELTQDTDDDGSIDQWASPSPVPASRTTHTRRSSAACSTAVSSMTRTASRTSPTTPSSPESKNGSS